MAMVENRFSQLLLLLTALLFVTIIISVVSGQPSVTISLNGVTIPNDGYVVFNDIGRYDTGLLCNTDRSGCCRSSDASDGVAQGHWYRPDGTQVGSFTQEIANDPTTDFFSRDRHTGVVRLNRQGNPPERGRFHCEVPNANGDVVTVYVNIVDLPPTTPPPVTTITVSPITASGTATAGESYSLECIVTVAGSDDQPTITWLMGPMDNMITSGVMTTGVMSTLTFNPLAASHAGTYTCRATLDSAMESVSTTIDITVQIPTITVRVTSSVATPMVGSMYSLTCTVTGAGRLASAMMTYQWLKNGVVVSDQTMATLSFSPLTSSDAGSYTCQATVTSILLSDPITTASSNSLSVRLALPRPATIRISTNQDNPLMVRPVGSTVTLTCMADLDPAIGDVPVIVNIELRDPAGSPLATTAPPVSGSSYTSTTTISSFGRDQSGLYTCSATVSPSPPNSFLSDSSLRPGTLRVSTGVYLSLRGTVYANNSVIPITEIGTASNNGLQCITDRMPCCASAPNRLGQWLFPNGYVVPAQGLATTFYRTRGDDGTVNLNRLNTNVFTPTGLFCCEVPNASDAMQSLCANIESTTVNATVPATTVPSTTLPPTTVTVPATTVPLPQLPPSLGVQGLCSIVVWYSPVVESCEDIHGYEVRLYSTSPQSSHPNMTNRVGANRTFYMVEEEKLPNSHETYVQVRVIHQTGQVGEWSEGISLEGTGALYYQTDKEECCGTLPNRFGQFYYPSGMQVPIEGRQHGFYRNRGNQIIHLNRREGITSPTGTYRCEIPNTDDEIVKIYVTLTG